MPVADEDAIAGPGPFAHRQELVYLPPAWFRSQSRPKLPVLEMIGGEFAAPDNWIRSGNAVRNADEFAAKIVMEIATKAK